MEEFLEEAPILIAQAGPLKGEKWVLDKVITIGREKTCEVIIPDRQVSHFHARLTPTDDGIILEDLGSKNGVHRNGVPILGQVILRDGDIFQIALAQQFLYVASDATVPLQKFEINTRHLRMDLRSRKVWINTQLIDPPFSALQFRVLQILSEHQGQVVDRNQLVNLAWGEDQAIGVSDQALDALIRRIRDRIASFDPDHDYIVTVRGHGILLDNPPADSGIE